MKLPLTLLIGNMACMACVISAAYMASHSVDGWGWFLLVAVITFMVPSKDKE